MMEIPPPAGLTLKQANFIVSLCGFVRERIPGWASMSKEVQLDIISSIAMAYHHGMVFGQFSGVPLDPEGANAEILHHLKAIWDTLPEAVPGGEALPKMPGKRLSATDQ